MSLTLTETIGADDRELMVTGTVPDTVNRGFRFRLGNELLSLQSFGPDQEIPGAYARQWAGPDRNRWLVNRGLENSTAAGHSSGVEILAATDTFASSANVTPPSPFAGGGSITPGPFIEPTTSTPEALTLWLIDNGFMEAS